VPRVSQTTLKRLDRLDAPLRESRHRAAFVYALAHGIESLSASAQSQLTRGQRTILSWPLIATGTDAWEAQASTHQDVLMERSREDRTVL
jgi:hypothetical protein